MTANGTNGEHVEQQKDNVKQRNDVDDYGRACGVSRCSIHIMHRQRSKHHH